MRIALLTPTFSRFSGIDRLVEQKAEELAAKGHKVTVFALAADMKPKTAGLVVMGMPKNAFLERIYRLLFFLDFAKVNRYAAAMKDYDTVISFFYPMNIIAAKAKKKYGKRYAYYNAGIADIKLFGFLERQYLRLFRYLTNKTIRNADEAYSISDYLRRQLKKETGMDSTVEYVKIDTKRFGSNMDKKAVAAVRKKYGIKGRMLLYVGRISPHKGIHLLLRAFEIIKRQVPGTQLIIVGKHTFGTYSKELKSEAEKLQDVAFAGYVADEELPHYYGACDLYVTASLWEGFDIPAVEAQACGKKVVAFDVGSHKEVVKSGVLVEPGNVQRFAEATIKMLKLKGKEK